MDWTDDAIMRLRSLWDDGLSTAEIGRRLGISKNAVVGKAHRLDLPARPSPIRRDPATLNVPREPAPRRVSGPTLPSMAEPPEAPVSPATPAAASPAPAITPVAAPPVNRPARPSLVAAMTAPIRLSPRAPACCWPIGEPGTATFRFCGEPALNGKPYCGPHADIAYVRVRDRREDVA
ncbi:GcrA cell cycle regulator [Acidiphilium sp. PA]|uniref:GcrA family cell cycle regulator n=1 Tax=Acidiphilium sp. PA TaxID=2871705 RepID=UPI0022432DFE|nr:GcrA family cell cycle regulator [Acidiphilium sp. PA]MCW8307939.1 GcrA cell cycle regulator [Acidiphilium sp. PA]